MSLASSTQLSITAMPIDAPILMLCPLRTNGAQMMPRMLCDRLQRIAVRSAGHNDGEFIAAEPSDQVVVIDDLAQSLGDIDNELIADMVAERVVDVLEM